MVDKPIKVAIYSGTYPDTTFITLLIDELAKSKVVKPYIFGKKNNNTAFLKNNGAVFCLIPSNKLLKTLCFFKLLILLILKDRKLVYELLKIVKLQYPNSIKSRINALLKILPFAIYKPDVLHIQWIKAYAFFEPFLNKLDLKLIVSLRGHQLSISSFIYDHYKKNAINALRNADAIHSISEDLTAQALSLHSFCEKKITKIPPAIDTSFFKKRHLLPKPRAKVKLVSVCRLSWKKGLIYALRAVKSLTTNGHDIEYKIIGAGSQREELQFLIHKLGLTGKVHLIGRLPQNDVKAILGQSDIFLLPSVQEGFSNAVLEAQAIGVPCLVSDAEGLSENVKHGETGFVFKKRCPYAIVDAFKKWNTLTEREIANMQLACQKRVRELFLLSNQIDAFVFLYKSVAEK